MIPLLLAAVLAHQVPGGCHIHQPLEVGKRWHGCFRNRSCDAELTTTASDALFRASFDRPENYWICG